MQEYLTICCRPQVEAQEDDEFNADEFKDFLTEIFAEFDDDNKEIVVLTFSPHFTSVSIALTRTYHNTRGQTESASVLAQDVKILEEILRTLIEDKVIRV